MAVEKSTFSVLVIVPFALDETGIKNRRRQLEHVALDPRMRFDFRGVKAGPSWFDSNHDLLLADVSIYEAGVSAEEEGYDAVVIDTVSDSGAQALRSVLDIPVIGPARVMYLVALMLGNRFSVVTQWDPWKASYKKSLQELGLADRCASVRSINVDPDVRNLIRDKQDVPELLTQAALKCVEEDGADVVMLGSTTMHDAVERMAERVPVPVINPGPLSYKIAEAMLTLGLAQSRALYQRPRAFQPEMVHRMMAAAADSSDA